MDGGARDRELEPGPPVAPVAGDDRGAGRLDVGGRHRPQGGSGGWTMVLMAAIIGPWPPCRAPTSSTSPISPASASPTRSWTRLEGQLNHILDQYAILATVPTDHIAPTAQTIELENILRDDVARPSLTVEEVLANAPAREGDFVVVPAILAERD